MSFTSNPRLKRISAYINEFAIPALYLIVVLGIIVLIVGKHFPKVGHDYGFFIPRMLDTHLHHKVNGLGIQWYTANFGAGTPAYPNPQYIQYSLPQFLMFVVNPWTALIFSLVTYAAIGFTGFYLFLRQEMRWIRNASALGASFIVANGFFVDHAIVGHVGFQSFPLLGVIFFLLFSKSANSLLAGVLLGLVAAMIINQAGFIVLVVFVLSLLTALPIIYLLRPELFQPKLFIAATTGVFSAALLSISKVSAVMAFMRFFPRFIEDPHQQTYLQGMLGMLKQLSGFTFIVPYHLFTDGKVAGITSFFQTGAGDQFGIWETNISLSPGLLGLLLVGVVSAFLARRKSTPGISRDKWIAVIVLGLAVWLTMDMSLAQGLWFRLVKPLPVIRSLHANIRYTAAFIFPLSLLGAYVFHQAFKTRPTGDKIAFGVASVLTVAMLCLYFVIPQDVYNRSFNLKSALLTYSQVDKGRNFTLTNIADITDMEVFQTGNSNLASQDPIFGYQGEYFKPQAVPGPIMGIRNGHYNMTNPASYVFPAENSLEPFELFRANEREDLELFINHKQPKFKISNWQGFADGLSLTALAVVVLYLVFEFIKGSIRVWQTISQRRYSQQEQVI